MKTILTFTMKLDEKTNEVSVRSNYLLTREQEVIAIKETNRLLQELLEITEEDTY